MSVFFAALLALISDDFGHVSKDIFSTYSFISLRSTAIAQQIVYDRNAPFIWVKYVFVVNPGSEFYTETSVTEFVGFLISQMEPVSTKIICLRGEHGCPELPFGGVFELGFRSIRPKNTVNNNLCVECRSSPIILPFHTESQSIIGGYDYPFSNKVASLSECITSHSAWAYPCPINRAARLYALYGSFSEYRGGSGTPSALRESRRCDFRKGGRFCSGLLAIGFSGSQLFSGNAQSPDNQHDAGERKHRTKPADDIPPPRNLRSFFSRDRGAPLSAQIGCVVVLSVVTAVGIFIGIGRIIHSRWAGGVLWLGVGVAAYGTIVWWSSPG